MSSHPKNWLLRLLCCVLLWAGGSAVFAQKTPEKDDFLQLLRTELQSQYDSLQHTPQPPYFMAYRVNETTEHSITANFGKIYDNSTAKSVILTIEMRVGTPETDNYHYFTYQNTAVRQIPLPLDGNPVIVRKILRNETRKAYQEAVKQYVENKDYRVVGGSLPVTDSIMRDSFWLGLYPGMTPEKLQYMIQTIKDFVASKS